MQVIVVFVIFVEYKRCFATIDIFGGVNQLRVEGELIGGYEQCVDGWYVYCVL